MAERITSLEDYRRLRESFERDCPAEFNFRFDVVDRWVEKNPEQIALCWIDENSERMISFAEFSGCTNRVANVLTQLGLAREAKILVILPRVPEWWEAMVGIFKAGMIAVPGTVQLTSHDIAYRIHEAGVSAVITDESAAEKLSQISEPLPSLERRILIGESAEWPGSTEGSPQDAKDWGRRRLRPQPPRRARSSTSNRYRKRSAGRYAGSNCATMLEYFFIRNP